MSSASTILVIAPPAELAGLGALLRDGGFASYEHADGGAGTLDKVRECAPDVVVIQADLEREALRALTAGIRDVDATIKQILVGAADGPVRNALEAADFAVDRFVARPLVANSLVSVVRACIDARQRAREQAGESAVPHARTERKMSIVVDQAIDEFVRSAMESLPPAPYPLAPPSAAPPPAPPPAGRRSRRPRNTMRQVPPPPVESADGADGDAGPEDALDGAGPAAREARPEPGDAAAPNVGELPPPRPRGGAFARELRRKMSDMAARLFPSETGKEPVDLGVSSSHEDEIDLSAFGVDTVVEGTTDSAALDQLPGTSAVAKEYKARDGGASEDAAVRDGNPAQVAARGEPAEDAPLAAPSDDGRAPEAGGRDGAPDGSPAGAYKPPSREALAPRRRRRRPTPVLAPSMLGDEGPSRERSSFVAALADTPSSDAISALGKEEASEAGAAGANGVALGGLPVRGPIRRGETDAAVLIEYTHRERFTGKVVFQHRGVTKEIFFDKGRPVFAGSDMAHDRMGEQLFREGKITTEQYEHVRVTVAETGRRMGEVLIELGWLKRRELMPVVRKHIEDIVYSLFAWDGGTYEMVPGPHPTGERIRISRHPAAMILEGVRRKFALDALLPLIGAPESVIEIVDDRKLKSAMSVADLNSTERRALTSFDGIRSLEEVQQLSGMELVEVYQLAYGLLVWGAAHSRRLGQDTRLPVEDEPAAIGETELAIDRGRVTAKYGQVVEADYFTLLGLRRDATSFEVKRAYEAARRDFQRDSFPAEIRSELGARIDEINEVLEEAYLVLRDDGLRNSYLSHLRD